jgi:phosphatidylinositol alpha-1,6-mannosyltransferase
VLISALPEIRRKIPNVLCAVVGCGEERATLERLVEENALESHVHFLGEVSDEELIRCYQQCDLFVLPNRRIGGDIEGFGIVLLEAQACGKPVVAGDSGGTRETMQIPETGLVVPCETPDELASVVSELLADNARLGRMGRAAREWILAEYDWEARRRKADALFREAMFKTVEI